MSESGDEKPGSVISEAIPPTPWVFHTLEDMGTLAFFGLCGSLGRMGLNRITAFEWGGVVWANITGCIVMGAHNDLFAPALGRIIASGFCGAMTSFSTMMTQLFEFSTTREPTWKNNGYGVMQFLAYLFVQLMCSTASYNFGRQLAKFLVPHFPTLPDKLILRVTAVIGFAAWITSIVLACTVEKNRYWSLGAAFTPFGSWIRFYLAHLNRPDYKWGTIIVNFCATLFACCLALANSPDINKTILQQEVVSALSDGFCGTLSTVSTFIAELYMLPVKRAYAYCIASITVGFSLAVIIIGSYNWTR